MSFRLEYHNKSNSNTCINLNCIFMPNILRNILIVISPYSNFYKIKQKPISYPPIERLIDMYVYT